MEHSKLLGEEKIEKLLLKFSIPAIVGMIVSALYNIVDRIYIGRGVGSLGIAGLTICYPIMIIIMAFGMLVGVGATSLISIRLGEQKRDEAEIILANGMVLLILISIIVSILGLTFLNPLLKLFGASNNTLPYAKQYLTIILIGTIFQTVGFGMNNFIRAEGNPKTAMMTMLIGAISNIILDPIFIFGFKLGVKGAAIATVLSQIISTIWVLSYFFSDKSHLKIHIANIKLQAPIVGKILAIGSAPFSMQVAASCVSALFNNQLSYYGGDIAISAMGIINSIVMLILMPIFGINQGAQPIIGYNYGAKKFDRVIKALKLAILAATTIVVIGFIATRVFPEQLISLFDKKDKELIKVGAQGMRIFLSMLPIIGFQIVSSNYFQAVGKPKQAMFLSLSRQVLVLIPALIILPKFFKLKGIWMAGPVSDFISSILTGTFLFLELKKLKGKHQIMNNFNPKISEE
ncbi:multidrug transporter MatE [Caloranaerobacter azorensis H53214]|uniref:Multidrug export protein MepA n=1 Tax=Caloranaerobacter azorensis H53214 TaxID=1156417 RepID=A0A096BFI4_9FIRM|nr:MATE family efflux transporter [Caloranaerobacter azorensis]KGG79602.1 multidrug transporter MatE [Caloranaerobacter azorensis H53214]